jgi:putative methionine-R-sulfoxide reductase with GAF domain/predicted pyridoxine 5'-phosphate oxidase superfamily flavin-nucleotide-binding protein
VSAPASLAPLHASCFQGVIPSILATADADGSPNVTLVSQIHRLDDRHVAVSRQFFNKTTRNLEANPRAAVELYDPLTFEATRLRLRFLRSETGGPLFDAMALRIQAIASHTGMSGVFRLKAADVFEVERVEPIAGFRAAGACPRPDDALTLAGHRSELRGLQWVSERVNRSGDLGSMMDAVLEALDSYFGFRHATVLLADEVSGKLVALASRGYGEAGIGAEVAAGEGLIGTVARERRVLRISGLDQELSYGRAVRREALLAEGVGPLAAEIPLPGLKDARSALVIPLVVRDHLVGVLAAESRDPVAFDEWHEAYLEVLGNQIALGLERMLEPGAEERPDAAPAALAAEAAPVIESAAAQALAAASGRRHCFVFYRNDDCVFVDGEYLIRNVPGRILWKLLGQYREGRTSFSNRELRLDPSLGLPAFRDNLESRLVLLRRRLEQKCSDVRLVPTGRGRFALLVDGPIELSERDSA